MKIKKSIKVLIIIIVSFMFIIYGGVFLGHKVIFPMKTSKVPTINAVTDGH
jgi:ABC-type thiamin/hydroxymethylpyrimidine transport system permease subunit